MIAARTPVSGGLGLRSIGAADAARDDLRDRFLDASSSAPFEVGGWLGTWRLVVAHPWYRRELSVAAAVAVRRVGGPRSWRPDVEHDAMLLLARKLRRDPTLGLDQARAAAHFGGWMGRVVRNDCRQAVRRLRRLGRFDAALPDVAVTASADAAARREAAAELYLAIGRLADPAKSVLMLMAKGRTLTEAAEALGLSYWQAWRACRDGRGRLRSMLGPPE